MFVTYMKHAYNSLKLGSSPATNFVCVTLMKQAQIGFVGDVYATSIKQTQMGHLRAHELRLRKDQSTGETPQKKVGCVRILHMSRRV